MRRLIVPDETRIPAGHLPSAGFADAACFAVAWVAACMPWFTARIVGALWSIPVFGLIFGGGILVARRIRGMREEGSALIETLDRTRLSLLLAGLFGGGAFLATLLVARGPIVGWLAMVLPATTLLGIGCIFLITETAYRFLLGIAALVVGLAVAVPGGAGIAGLGLGLPLWIVAATAVHERTRLAGTGLGRAVPAGRILRHVLPLLLVAEGTLLLLHLLLPGMKSTVVFGDGELRSPAGRTVIRFESSASPADPSVAGGTAGYPDELPPGRVVVAPPTVENARRMIERIGTFLLRNADRLLWNGVGALLVVLLVAWLAVRIRYRLFGHSEEEGEGPLPRLIRNLLRPRGDLSPGAIPSDPRAAVIFLYHRMREGLAPLLGGPAPARTPTEIARIAAGRVPDLAADVASVTVAFHLARYSVRPVDPGTADRVRRQVSRIGSG